MIQPSQRRPVIFSQVDRFAGGSLLSAKEQSITQLEQWTRWHDLAISSDSCGQELANIIGRDRSAK